MSAGRIPANPELLLWADNVDAVGGQCRNWRLDPPRSLEHGGLSVSASYHLIQIFNFKIVAPQKYKWLVTHIVWYSSYAFDEKLHEHISQDLADDVGPERFRDTS